MADVNILLYVESRYKVNRKRIKKTIETILDEQNVTSRTEVSVAIVGDRKMAHLNKKFRGKTGTTNILSFPLSEGDTMPTESNVARLGDIVISYPVLINEAAKEEMLVDDRVEMLIAHGMGHLMGIHHE